MANRLQIKRNTTTDNAPTTLHAGELAYTSNTNTVYVGSFDNLGDVLVLSEGDAVVQENGTTGSEMLVLEDTDGTHTVTLQAPPNLTADITLKFPAEITVNQMLVGNSNGQLAFKSVTTGSLTSVADLETNTISNNDVLKWDATTNGGAGEWKHISNDDFRTLLGFGSGDSTYHNMIVDGTLIIGGATEFGTANTIIKDKTLALGVSGGVKEGVIDSYNNDTGATVVNVASLGAVATGEFRWLDVGGFSDVVASTTTTTNTLECTLTSGLNIGSGVECLVSANPVSDVFLDGAGFRLVGTTNKTFQWNKSTGNDANPYFELDGGNLIIKDGDKLYMDGQEVFDTTTDTLHPSISLDAEQLDETVALDGGTY
jgi:hypothetical protein